MKSSRGLIVLIVCGYLSWVAPALADAVADWNAVTAQAIATAAVTNSPPRPGPSAILDYAMVHAAVHDAVQAIEGEFEPYAIVIPGASGSSIAAAATAAHDMLVNRFPAQAGSLDSTSLPYLAANGLTTSDPRVAVGQQAAAGLIVLRANDGSFQALPPFIGGTDPGVWRPTTSYLPGPPPSNSPMAAEWLATMTPFTLTSPDQFRGQGPPALTSGHYRNEYNEVKRLGSDVNSERTQAQTDLATFFNLNFLQQYNQAVRDIAGAHVDDIAESARLFALVNLAMADAAITAWD